RLRSVYAPRCGGPCQRHLDTAWRPGNPLGDAYRKIDCDDLPGRGAGGRSWDAPWLLDRAAPGRARLLRRRLGRVAVGLGKQTDLARLARHRNRPGDPGPA